MSLLTQSVFLVVKEYSKVNNITIKEALEKLKEFKRDLSTFKSRLSFVKSLEINVKEYSKDPVKKDYQLLIGDQILDFILNLDNKVESFKVTFTDDTYYAYYSDNSREYISGYNEVVVSFLLKYI